MKNRIDTSRRKTPWDNCTETSTVQSFIMNKYKDNYYIKHQKLLDTNENILINSIEIDDCPYCRNKNICKKGFTNNKIQRYYCYNCKRRFTPLTNTIFDDHKLPITEWIEFLNDIFNYGSISLTSKVNKNSVTTTTYWLQKLFCLLRVYNQNIKLSGTVYLDEFYYSVIKSDIELKEDGTKLRGISRNKYCIGIAYDKTNIIATIEGLGKPTVNKTRKAFLENIENGSKLIHDDEKSHKILIEELELKDECYKSIDLKELNDDNNPLRPINHQCDLLRQFLNVHSGFDRNYLQDYLNLYCFMNSGKSKNKLEKINILLEFALKTRVSLKYRNMYSKN